jgi:Arc/MetJ-type ribon-helix-helix transcriptional regulator
MARITVTLDPDVAQLIEDAVRRGRTSKKQVINDALRRALSQPASRREPYRLEVHSATLQPGLDLAGFNRQTDELEDEAILAPGRRASP